MEKEWLKGGGTKLIWKVLGVNQSFINFSFVWFYIFILQMKSLYHKAQEELWRREMGLMEKLHSQDSP